MLRHDFRCQKCGHTMEVEFASFDDFRRELDCTECDGVAVQVWLRSPGLAGVWEPGTRGVKRTFTPGSYDIQSGRTFESLSERDAYVKSRGLIAMGPDEYKRTVNTSSENQEADINKDKLREAMKDAWDENMAGKITPHLVVDDKIKPVIAE